MGLSTRCSMNKDGDTLCAWARAWPPRAVPVALASSVSAAVAVLTGVKGRFYYSHGRANALIQRRGTVPSGQREGGRNLPSTCWKGFKADFTPSSSGLGKQGRSEPGWREPVPATARGRCCSLLASASREPACPEQDMLWDGAGGTNKVTITLFLLILFFTTFLLLFIYFIVSLLLSVFLVLLGKTKHHLKKCTGEGRRWKRHSALVYVPISPAESKAPARHSPGRTSRFPPASRQPRQEGSSLQ